MSIGSKGERRLHASVPNMECVYAMSHVMYAIYKVVIIENMILPDSILFSLICHSPSLGRSSLED
jgi:hypothetical protein